MTDEKAELFKTLGETPRESDELAWPAIREALETKQHPKGMPFWVVERFAKEKGIEFIEPEREAIRTSRALAERGYAGKEIPHISNSRHTDFFSRKKRFSEYEGHFYHSLVKEFKDNCYGLASCAWKLDIRLETLLRIFANMRRRKIPFVERNFWFEEVRYKSLRDITYKDILNEACQGFDIPFLQDSWVGVHSERDTLVSRVAEEEGLPYSPSFEALSREKQSCVVLSGKIIDLFGKMECDDIHPREVNVDLEKHFHKRTYDREYLDSANNYLRFVAYMERRIFNRDLTEKQYNGLKELIKFAYQLQTLQSGRKRK